jgi:hypothetical protein
MKLLMWTLLFSLSTAFAMSDVTGHFTINGKKKLMMKAGMPAVIEVWFTHNENNEVVKDYKVMHGKLMHMVLIKNDHSEFKHIHPYFDPVTGRFSMAINLPHSDPDNFDNQVTEAGMYMLMADVEVKGKGMRMEHKMLHVMGQASREVLQLDPIANGIITKEFMTHTGPIRGHFTHTKTYGCGNVLVDAELTLEKFENGNWLPLGELENWLSMGAHSIWVSEKFMGMPMSYAHMHAKIPGIIIDENGDEIDEGPWDSVLRFNFNDQMIMKSGKQKIWIQIKHQGLIYTLPFVFSYNNSGATTSC